MATIQLRLLGAVQVHYQGTLVTGFESRKAISLLCYLAAHNQPVSRSQLAAVLWEDKSESRGRANLSRVIHNLSTLLPGCIEADRHYAQFVRSPEHWIDVDELAQLVEEGSAESLVKALSLHRGEFMGDLDMSDSPEFDSWLAGQREQWRQQISQHYLSLISLYTSRGAYDLAIQYTSRLLTLEPWREEAHRQMMLLLAMTGQRSAALIHYEQCRVILAEELDVEPSEETRALYHRIREQGFPERIQRDVPSARLPFVGREEEHARLVDLAEQSRRGARKFVWLSGAAGIGKTRLVEEVLRYVENLGVTVLRGKSYEFSTPVPYQCVAQAMRGAVGRVEAHDFLSDIWLSELAALLPEIRDLRPDLREPLPVSEDAGRQRLFEAIARFIKAMATSQNPVLFFLDDLHWADQASLDLVHYLYHRLHECPVMLIGTYRPEELTSGDPLLQLLSLLQQEEQVYQMELGRLDAAAISRVTGEMNGLTAEQLNRLSTYLVSKSEGNPFILDHLLQELLDEGNLRRRGNGWAEAVWTVSPQGEHYNGRIPSGVVQMIQRRVDRLPRASRWLLHVAAIIGRTFDPALLQEVAGSDVAVADELRNWMNRNLVYAQPPSGYTFAHDMIRQAIFDAIPHFERQQLHGRVAAAMEGLYYDQDEDVEELAYHYRASGDRQRALSYLLSAARRAEQRYAWEVAIHHYTQAHALVPRSDTDNMFLVLFGRERVYNVTAQRAAQDDDLEALENLARRLNDEIRWAEILCRRTEWALHTGRFARGMELTCRATRLAQRSDRPDLVASTLRYGALCAMNQGDFYQARQWGETALGIYEEGSNRRGRALALGTLGLITRSQEFLNDARRYTEEAVNEWRSLVESWYLANSLSSLSLIYLHLGQFSDALASQLEARQIASQIGDVNLNASTLTSMGSIYHALGHYGRAMTCYEEALEMGQTLLGPKQMAAALLCRGHTHLRLGHIEEATEDYQASLAIQSQLDMPVMRVETLNGLADCLLATASYREVLAVLDEGVGLLETVDQPGLSEILVRRAEAHTGLGQPQQARQELDSFLELIDRSDSRERPTTHTWWRAGYVLGLCGKKAESVRLLEQGDLMLQEQAERLGDKALKDQFLQAALDWQVNAPYLSLPA